MQITMRYQYTPIRMTKIKILTIKSASEDEEQLEFSYIGEGIQKWHRHSGKHFGSFFKS